MNTEIIIFMTMATLGLSQKNFSQVVIELNMRGNSARENIQNKQRLKQNKIFLNIPIGLFKFNTYII